MPASQQPETPTAQKVSRGISVVALLFSAIALHYSIRSFEREHRYEAVWHSSTLDELNTPIFTGKLVPIALSNHSKHTTEIEVIVQSEGCYVDLDKGDTYTPMYGRTCITLGRFVVAPTDIYRQKLRIYTRSDKPAIASINVFLNGVWTVHRKYKYDSETGYYYLAN